MKKFLVLSLVLLVAAYFFWRNDTGFTGENPVSAQPIFFSTGTNQGIGNLVGIQPYMFPSDYATAETFETKIGGYLAAAKEQGYLNEKTIVVLPEYLGTWLVVLHEKNAVYTSKNTGQALSYLVLRHPVDFLQYFLGADEKERDKAALFHLKARAMAIAYADVFSTLSRKFQVTIVAGSIVLPNPELDEVQNLHITPGEKLYNITAVFNPEGKIQPPLVRKIFPIDTEIGFVCAGEPNQTPVFDTPAGKLGVLVCADSWYPEPYKNLEAAEATLLAIPSYSSPDGIWSTPWAGYNPGPFPEDVDQHDVKKLREAEAWKKYSMGGRASAHNIAYGINVFLRGELWDLGSDGHTLLLQQGDLQESKDAQGAVITNVWIEKF